VDTPFKITPQLSRPQTCRLKDLRSPMGIAKYWFRPSDNSLSIMLLRGNILYQKSYSQLSTERSKTGPHDQNVSSYFDLRRQNQTPRHRTQPAELLTRYSQAVRRIEVARSVLRRVATSRTGNYSSGSDGDHNYMVALSANGVPMKKDYSDVAPSESLRRRPDRPGRFLQSVLWHRSFKRRISLTVGSPIA
jgi:hypothetical protein